MKAVVTISSDNYVKYTKVLIYSFYKNNKEYDGDFIILYDNIYASLSDISIKYLESLHKNVKCVLVDSKKYKPICDKFYGKLWKKSWISCCLKFYLFELGQKYDKILYLDGDMLVTNALNEIFDLDVSLAAVSEETRYDKVMINKNEYFNAGLIYFGNNTYCNQNTLNDIINFTFSVDFKTPYSFKNKIVMEFNCWEQDIFNVFFRDKTDKYGLPYKYNTPFSVENNALTSPNWELTESIIHFWSKPDNYEKLYGPSKLWNEYNNEMKTN